MGLEIRILKIPKEQGGIGIVQLFATSLLCNEGGEGDHLMAWIKIFPRKKKRVSRA
jgi:hypothetical protein